MTTPQSSQSPVGGGLGEREMLELAAKAAGIEYDAEASKPHPTSGAFWGLWLVYHREPTEYDRRYWNPLRDDGDALRLAVKLGFRINTAAMAHWGMNTDISDSRCDRAKITGYGLEPHGDDPGAATRRAIVRAAAAMASERGAGG